MYYKIDILHTILFDSTNNQLILPRYKAHLDIPCKNVMTETVDRHLYHLLPELSNPRGLIAQCLRLDIAPLSQC